VSFGWVPAAAVVVKNRVLRRPAETVSSPVMQRLRSRKAEVTQTLEQQRAAARFEPQPDAPPPDSAAAAELTGAPPADGTAPAKPPTPPVKPEQKEDDSYTSRLLKAKKKVWDERNDQR
jgi:hypothetical protein